MPNGNILVVDDEPSILRLTQRLLEREGFEIITSFDPHDALEILGRQPVDLLLADIRLPGMDGFQLMTTARKQLPDLPVVIMTGYGTVETAVEALHRGADGLILKPFINSDFILGVKNALQENQRKREVSRLRTLRTLFDVTEVMFAETDVEKLQALVIDTIYTHMNSKAVLLYQRKGVDVTLQLLNQKGNLSQSAISVLEEEYVKSAERGNRIQWSSRQMQTGGENPSAASLLEDLDLEAVFCAPVYRKRKYDGKVVDVFLAARITGQEPFTQVDYEMFAVLVKQAGAALENADLYAELRYSVSQLEKSQRALIQAEKMAAAGRLTASIAHEINNPLQSVQNCLYLARREDLGKSERRKYQDLAQSELERLITTVQRMLDFYRPGIRDRQAEKVDRLVERVLLLVGPQLLKNGISVETHLSAVTTEVMVVGNQIQQVLINLILNSMEAMPGGGTICIETASKNGKAEILIRDNGPGVVKSVQDHLFDPFVSTKENGTGLGLALSSGIITAHGGSLDLIPQPGGGACFQILLPIGDQS
jgi:signal transduction histidine kinase/DNA-binding response OmpR family regulator